MIRGIGINLEELITININSAITTTIEPAISSAVEELDLTGYGFISIPALSFKAKGTKDPTFMKIKDNGSGSTGIYSWAFNKNTEEELFSATELPSDHNDSTDIYGFYRWISLVDGAVDAKVSWGCEINFTGHGDVMQPTTIMYQDTPRGWAVGDHIIAYKTYCNIFGPVTGFGFPIIAPQMVMRMFRDSGGVGGTDSFNNDAVLLSIGLYYQKNGFGYSTDILNNV